MNDYEYAYEMENMEDDPIGMDALTEFVLFHTDIEPEENEETEAVSRFLSDME